MSSSACDLIPILCLICLYDYFLKYNTTLWMYNVTLIRVISLKKKVYASNYSSARSLVM